MAKMKASGSSSGSSINPSKYVPKGSSPLVRLAKKTAAKKDPTIVAGKAAAKKAAAKKKALAKKPSPGGYGR